MRLEQTPKLYKKGHERQYVGMKDHVDTATQILSKLKPADDREDLTVKAGMEELDEDRKGLQVRQKLTPIVDRLELGWQVIDAYKWMS